LDNILEVMAVATKAQILRWSSSITSRIRTGSFKNTPLDTFLKERGIDTASIAGFMTQVCCDTTARQAVHRDYKVGFLQDSTGKPDVESKTGAVTAEQLHESVLVAQQMFFRDVIDRETWLQRIALLDGSTCPLAPSLTLFADNCWCEQSHSCFGHIDRGYFRNLLVWPADLQRDSKQHLISHGKCEAVADSTFSLVCALGRRYATSSWSLQVVAIRDPSSVESGKFCQCSST
jgi:hypothetical protein